MAFSAHSTMILVTLLAVTFSLVYAVPHCPGGQLVPTMTITATTTISVTTTIHHTATVTRHIPSIPFSSSAVHTKHRQSAASSAPAVTVLTGPPTSTGANTAKANLPTPKGGSAVSFPPNSSNLFDPKSTSINDCDTLAGNQNGDSPDSTGTHSIPNPTSFISSIEANNSTRSITAGYPTVSDEDSDRNGEENENSGLDGESPISSNSNGSTSSSDVHNETVDSTNIISHQMKLCCNTKGQADSLVITLMAGLGFDFSNRTGLIGVGCTLIGEGSLRDESECTHSLLECGFFSPLNGVGSQCSF